MPLFRNEDSPKEYQPLDPYERAAKSGEVPDHPIVQWLEVDESKFGLKDSKEKFQFQKVTIPIYDKTGFYICEAGRYELDEGDTKPEGKDDRPYVTVVIMGGGSSGGMDNMHLVLKLREAVKEFNRESKLNGGEPFPAKLRVVTLSHLGGMSREIDEGFVDPAKQENLAEGARILKQAMDAKELGVTGEVGFIGASAGGAQVTELAALVADRCKFVGLMDAAGMAEHPSLPIDFTVGQMEAVYRKYYEKGMGIFGSLKAGLHELYDSTSTRHGNLANILQLGKDYTVPVRQDENRHNEMAWGGLNSKGEVLPAKTLGSDSTEKAREKIKAPIIFSPVIYANVVNTMMRRLGDKIYGIKTVEDMKKKRTESDESRKEFEDACQEILQELFPNVSPQDLTNLPYEGTTHTAYIEKEFFSPFVKAIAEKL